jgi:hypothetical protein
MALKKKHRRNNDRYDDKVRENNETRLAHMETRRNILFTTLGLNY